MSLKLTAARRHPSSKPPAFVAERIEWFAYPYGAYNGAVRRCVDAAGFRFACAVDPGGFELPAVDPLALPRTDLALARTRATGLGATPSKDRVSGRSSHSRPPEPRSGAPSN